MNISVTKSKNVYNEILAYRSDIDGLRALAVLAVIFEHYGLSWAKGGFVGVDIFFVISGFLITSIVKREIEQKTFSFGMFYRRRFRRIFPAFFVVVIACFLAAALVMLHYELTTFSKSAIAAVLSVSNIYFWKNLGYFDGGAIETPLLHTWSLSVEEQYYLLMPIILMMIYRYIREYALKLFISGFVISLIISTLLV